MSRRTTQFRADEEFIELVEEMQAELRRKNRRFITKGEVTKLIAQDLKKDKKKQREFRIWP